MAKADKTANGETVSYDADVVVIGAGGAGMTAAMTAADAGQKVVILESQAMVGGNSARATGGMNAAKTVYQDENEFDQAAGVEKTLATAAEKYADNETITALAKTVSEQWAAYQANPTGYFDSVELMGWTPWSAARASMTRSWSRPCAKARQTPSTGWMRTASPCTTSPASAVHPSSASTARSTKRQGRLRGRLHDPAAAGELREARH